MKHHAWKTPREAIDDGRDEARAERGGAPDPHLARGRVGEELDVLDALAQLIEGSMAATEYGAPVFGEFGAVIMVSSGFPGVSQTLTLLVHGRYLDDHNTFGAYSAATLLMGMAIVALALMTLLDRKRSTR